MESPEGGLVDSNLCHKRRNDSERRRRNPRLELAIEEARKRVEAVEARKKKIEDDERKEKEKIEKAEKTMECWIMRTVTSVVCTLDGLKNNYVMDCIDDCGYDCDYDCDSTNDTTAFVSLFTTFLAGRAGGDADLGAALYLIGLQEERELRKYETGLFDANMTHDDGDGDLSKSLDPIRLNDSKAGDADASTLAYIDSVSIVETVFTNDPMTVKVWYGALDLHY
ncbi:hypothetical protein V493_05573 [Pseudogymnoascus sp. VKM F-4281 (FW-2241)]|nr:hypothetical protein V493_05573 [Pseudogymnoascus sp. VKM F-4281 (FW-2241)]